jgi:hypothetical protein
VPPVLWWYRAANGADCRATRRRRAKSVLDKRASFSEKTRSQPRPGFSLWNFIHATKLGPQVAKPSTPVYQKTRHLGCTGPGLFHEQCGANRPSEPSSGFIRHYIRAYGTGTELRLLPRMTFLFDKQVNKINLIVSCKAVGVELRKSYEDVLKSKPPQALTELIEMLERLNVLRFKSATCIRNPAY